VGLWGFWDSIVDQFHAANEKLDILPLSKEGFAIMPFRPLDSLKCHPQAMPSIFFFCHIHHIHSITTNFCPRTDQNTPLGLLLLLAQLTLFSSRGKGIQPPPVGNLTCCLIKSYDDDDEHTCNNKNEPPLKKKDKRMNLSMKNIYTTRSQLMYACVERNIEDVLSTMADATADRDATGPSRCTRRRRAASRRRTRSPPRGASHATR
jgi:hypothetical protein